MRKPGLTLGLLFLVWPVDAVAFATVGVVSGRVLDATNRLPVAEAEIRVLGSATVVATSSAGDFELSIGGAPARLRVLAPGYRPLEVLLESGFTEILLERGPDHVFNGSVTVRGSVPRLGEGLRLDQPLSEEVLRLRPHTSAAEALQRVAGAIAERDKGYADHVVIRGAESRLVATALDGEPLASPDGDVRSAGVGLVPADFLQEVRVSKTVTPGMDGNAIGGVINLVTREAPTDGLRTVDISNGWDSETENRLVAGGATVGRRFDKGGLGALLSAHVQEADRGAERLEASYRGGLVSEVDLGDYTFVRQRQGFAAALDSSPNDATALRAKGLFGSLATDELIRSLEFDLADREIERELKDSRLVRDISSATLGGDHRLGGGFHVDYKIGAQRASETEPGRIDTSFIQENVSFAPKQLQPVPLDEDIRRFRLDQIGVEDNSTKEEDVFVALNLSARIRQRSDPGLFRAGLKLRDKEKSRDADTTGFEPERTLFLASFLDSGFADDAFLRGRYALGPMVDRDEARGLIDRFDLTGDRSFEEEVADYRARETTSAAYVMAELTLGESFTMLPGVRYERTSSDYLGFEVIAADSLEDSSKRDVAGSGSYGMWLPGIHASYSIGPSLVLRGAFTRTLARPDYFDLVPYRIFDFEDAELELGNAALRPTSALNLDLEIDWRPSSASQFSVGLFQKKMADFIFSRRSLQEILSRLFEVSQPVNGHRASLRGIEASLRHRFGSRSGLFEGLGLEVRLAGTESSAVIDELESTRLRLPSQPSLSGQLLLTYNRGRVFGELSAGYFGQYLLELGNDRAEDLYVVSQRRLDVAAGFSATERTQIFLRIDNLADEPFLVYEGSPDRSFLMEYTGWSVRAGLKLQLRPARGSTR